jgi:hypothetical protein
VNRRILALAAGCAIIGATAASVLVPASADQVGGNLGSVTIYSPSVRHYTPGTRSVYPRFTTAGNIEARTGYLTIKKGTKTIATNVHVYDGLPKGTYTITTLVRYRYVTFRGQSVQVITKGSSFADILSDVHDPNSPDGTPAASHQCKVTAVDSGAGTYAASCAISYARTTFDPKSGEHTVTMEPLGSMTLTGTFAGTSALQDGYPGTPLTIEPTVGGNLHSAQDGDDIHATKNFSMTYFNRKAGPYHSKTRTVKVLIDQTVG